MAPWTFGSGASLAFHYVVNRRLDRLADGQPAVGAGRARHVKTTHRLESKTRTSNDGSHRPIEVAAARQEFLKRIETMLPAHDVRIISQAVLSNQQLPVRTKDAPYFGQHGSGIAHAAQGQHADDRVGTRIGQRQVLGSRLHEGGARTGHGDAWSRAGKHAVVWFHSSDAGHGRRIAPETCATAETNLDDAPPRRRERLPSQSLELRLVRDTVVDPGKDATFVEPGQTSTAHLTALPGDTAQVIHAANNPHTSIEIQSVVEPNRLSAIAPAHGPTISATAKVME